MCVCVCVRARAWHVCGEEVCVRVREGVYLGGHACKPAPSTWLKCRMPRLQLARAGPDASWLLAVLSMYASKEEIAPCVSPTCARPVTRMFRKKHRAIRAFEDAGTSGSRTSVQATAAPFPAQQNRQVPLPPSSSKTMLECIHLPATAPRFEPASDAPAAGTARTWCTTPPPLPGLWPRLRWPVRVSSVSSDTSTQHADQGRLGVADPYAILLNATRRGKKVASRRYRPAPPAASSMNRLR